MRGLKTSMSWGDLDIFHDEVWLNKYSKQIQRTLTFKIKFTFTSFVSTETSCRYICTYISKWVHVLEKHVRIKETRALYSLHNPPNGCFCMYTN